MISLQELQEILGLELLDGNYQIAGICIFIAVLAIMFTFCKNKNAALILAMPITLVFSLMGALASDVTVLLIIVEALALAFNAKRVF